MDKKVNTKVKNLLAEHLGVEVEDINDEDFLQDDLHMSATDISDFFQTLETAGLETAEIDIASVETVNDLFEALSSKEFIE